MGGQLSPPFFLPEAKMREEEGDPQREVGCCTLPTPSHLSLVFAGGENEGGGRGREIPSAKRGSRRLPARSQRESCVPTSVPFGDFGGSSPFESPHR